MIRLSSYSESCTTTITRETPTVRSEPSLTTLLLSNNRNLYHTELPLTRNHHPSRRRLRKHKSRPSSTPSSSRFFFLLLHLVGVSTNLHKRHTTWPGITAVHPAKTIYLQRLNIEGSRSLMELIQSLDQEELLLRDPFWFQDGEGRCLGIGGFGECGDTLWRVRREGRRRSKSIIRKRNTRKSKQREEPICVWPFFCESDSTFSQTKDYNNAFVGEHEGFALELVDADEYALSGYAINQKRKKRRRFLWLDGDRDQYEAECLLSFPSFNSSLQLGSCSSEEAWMWHLNRDGVLARALTKSEKRKKRSRWIGSPITAGNQHRIGSSANLDINFLCLHKVNNTGASLLPCRDDKTNAHSGALVEFSLVRYPSTMHPITLISSNGQEWSPWIAIEGSSSKRLDKKQAAIYTSLDAASDHHMPSSRTNTSFARQHHVEVKSAGKMLHTGLDQGTRKHHVSVRTSASHIRNAPSTTVEGLTFHNQHSISKEESEGSHEEKKPGQTKKTSLLHRVKTTKNSPKHSDEGDGGEHEDSESSAHHRPIKIPLHPYIEASRDGIWVDPLTSLQYPTDLCTYLGHTKTEAGRHTLMGVGQYYRTAFNIKVYGAAFYVAKRDVLADPKFARFASLTTEELHNRDDFYEHLMNMPSQGVDPVNSPGGFFDRTLMVKTNMQLSTDAMRKSLEADWSLLTDEMKTLIIESSFRERDADERMLERIKSKENSSNCSCGQSAPEHYAAEQGCCARGTELVFTWRKNGDFEVRLDGRLMDIFPRPDLARGIFAEYLNNDPISLDAKAHFADGFPFLLAPLAQVKGMSSAVPIANSDSPKMARSNLSGNQAIRLMTYPINVMNSQAHTMSRWVQEGAAELSSTFDDALSNAVDIARGVSAEIDRRRMELLDNAFALHDEVNSLIVSSLERDEKGKTLAISNRYRPPTPAPEEDGVFSNLPDEIGVEMEPTTTLSHWLFFTTVHLYLFLLFVVSLQDSAYTTKLVVKRKYNSCVKYK